MKATHYLLAGFLTVLLLNCKGQSENPGVDKETTVQGIQPASTEMASRVDAATVHLTKADFLRLVMDYEKNPDVWSYQGDKPCIIDFYADWCAPCRITSPILEELAKTYAGKITIYKIDIEQEKELAAVFGVQSIPTFLFCPLKGNPTISSGIANTPEATKGLFIKQIEELLLNKTESTPM